LTAATCLAVRGAEPDPWRVDFRYTPPDWQTSICLPDDWQKTLVGRSGALLYDYPGKFGGFGTRLSVEVEGGSQWLNQQLASPRVPIVRTIKRAGDLEVLEETFAVPPAAISHGHGHNPPGRADALYVQLRNRGRDAATVRPIVSLESESDVAAPSGASEARIGTNTLVNFSHPILAAERRDLRLVLRFGEITIPAGAERVFAITVARRGAELASFPAEVREVRRARQAATAYWEKLALPYDRLQVPDMGVQAALDSAVRNIYQAREIKRGLPAFQVGPTCYRGLWVVDGSFLLEAVTYLGRTNETRDGIKYLMGFQRPDGGFMLIDGHWKETGIVLWAIARHAQLTGDRAWLASVWPQVQRGFAFIRTMRQMPPSGSPNEGLIPDGFSDGGLADRVPEYTNVYWTMAGLRAAVAAARWLGRNDEAAAWQREYEDFVAAFRRAAERDARTDARGNRYVPIRMAKGEGIPPQKAQWAFLHAVFPGQVFAPDDALVRGNLAMLRDAECEGLVRDTGWLKNGLWTYFASFYAHAWLWEGEGDKAARTLYAFANHASPLLCWREEHMPAGEGAQVVGDMPHNWASAEFIRLVRHALALERGNELLLFEGFPKRWNMPGGVTRLRQVPTSFGPLSLEWQVAKDGRAGTLRISPPRRTPPARLVWHLEPWSGQHGSRELPPNRPSAHTLRLVP
jgi:hypothetical protein